MVGSAIADSDGGGGDSLYGPSPKSRPMTPRSPVPDFDDLGLQDPDTEKPDSLFGELQYAGSEEPELQDIQQREPKVKESEQAVEEHLPAEIQEPSTAPLDSDFRLSDSKPPNSGPPDAQIPSPRDPKTDNADLEPRPEVSSPKLSNPPSPKTITAETTAFLALASGSVDSASPENSPVITNKTIDTRQQRREAKKREQERKQSESTRIQDESMRILREQLKLGRLAICVGSGVTLYSASTQTSRLSWWGLSEYC